MIINQDYGCEKFSLREMISIENGPYKTWKGFHFKYDDKKLKTQQKIVVE